MLAQFFFHTFPLGNVHEGGGNGVFRDVKNGYKKIALHSVVAIVGFERLRRELITRHGSK